MKTIIFVQNYKLEIKGHSEILKINNLKRILFIFKVTVNSDLFKCSQIFHPSFELGFSLVPSYKDLGFSSFQSHLEKELKKLNSDLNLEKVPGRGHPG